MSEMTEFEHAADLGAAIAEPKQFDDYDPFVVIPAGYKLEGLERFRPEPSRVIACPKFDDVKGFAAYVTEFKCGHSKLFVQLLESSVRAIALLDYHTLDSASWCSWNAELVRSMAKEWLIWRQASGRWMTQADMAEFLQDNAPDVVDPPGAEMLELCTTFKQVASVEFESGYNIKNGAVQFSYVENVGGAAGAKGRLEIPSGFVIAIPVLDRGEGVRIACRFRYRISDKKLQLRYDIPQIHKILDVTMNAAVAELEDLTKLQAFLGKP